MDSWNAVALLLYHFLMMMTLSQDVNSEHRGSIVLIESFQYVCHLSHVANLLQSNYGKLMLPTSLGTRVYGDDQCITMNSTSIVPHGFQSPKKKNILRITPLSTWSPQFETQADYNRDGHQWTALHYMALPFLYQILTISCSSNLRGITLNSKWDPLFKNHYWLRSQLNTGSMKNTAVQVLKVTSAC